MRGGAVPLSQRERARVREDGWNFSSAGNAFRVIELRVVGRVCPQRAAGLFGHHIGALRQTRPTRFRLVRILYEAQPNKVLSPGRLLREAVMAAEVEG